MTDEELSEAEKRLIIDPESTSVTGLLTKYLTQPKVVHLEVEFAPWHLVVETAKYYVSGTPFFTPDCFASPREHGECGQ